jgi:hypothetical protein
MNRIAVLMLACAAAVLPRVASAQSEENENIPDLWGGWVRIGELVEMFEAIPEYGGAGPLLVDPQYPHAQGGVGEELRWVADLSNPILAPDTLARIRLITEQELSNIPHLKDESACRPSGVPMLWNRRGGAIQLLQTPTQITILNARDQQMRRIYLNVPHSDNPPLTWYGESVGHYEGSHTVVIDTIAQNSETQIDRFGTPHSDRIHVVERINLSADGQAMEVHFTVEDPVAFTMPWSGRVRLRHREADWDEQICAENNRHVGTVTFNGIVMTDSAPTPVDITPDF